MTVPQVLRRRWKAPQQHGELLDSPRLEQAGEVAVRNRGRLHSAAVTIDGQPLAALRVSARRELLLAGRRLLSELSGGEFGTETPCCCHADFDRRVDESLWFVSGHQPALTHAGVWVKNIAAALLAQKHSGLGANLIVDQDVISSRAISVPVGPVSGPGRTTVAFDEPSVARPGEEARIADLELFRHFGETVAEIVRREWGYEPLLSQVWSSAVREAGNSRRLTRALSAARIALERQHGLKNSEVEVSALSGTTAFLHFFRHLARNAAEFRARYNQHLAEYRRTNRVRSTAHPVPDLAQDGDAHELPFWLYLEGDVHRRRLFVRSAGDQLEITDGVKSFGVLNSAESAEGEQSNVEDLRALLVDGIRLRPRALATTLFARLCVADLFIHGIGGAKYDEMTDALGADFFGLEMPEFMTVTATQWLPIGGGHEGADRAWRECHEALRAARYKAEHLVGNDGATLAGEKNRLVASLRELRASGPRGKAGHRARAEVARQLRTIEQELASRAAHRIPQLMDQLRTAESLIAANSILRSREFAAVLHPMSSYAGWVSQIRERIDTAVV